MEATRCRKCYGVGSYLARPTDLFPAGCDCPAGLRANFFFGMLLGSAPIFGIILGSTYGIVDRYEMAAPQPVTYKIRTGDPPALAPATPPDLPAGE